MRNRRRLSYVLFVPLLMLLLSAPVLAQTAPIAFEDPAPVMVTWPAPVEVNVLNNTTETLIVSVEMTSFTASEGSATLVAGQVLQPLPPSITLQPAGQAPILLPFIENAKPAPGSYTGSLVLSVESHNAVLRKPVTIVVPLPAAGLEEGAGSLRPSVDAWTLNAVRLLPMLNPICLRGLLPGCSIPADGEELTADQPAMVNYLSNERGGGLAVKLTGYDARRGADLSVAFDRPWGLVGTYAGPIDFLPAAEESATVALTVNVKDLILWPLLTLWVGVTLARQVQHFLTVHRTTLRLLRRLDQIGLQFARLRKSIYGYSVSESFQDQRDELRDAVQKWDASHYGEPTADEWEELHATILVPLQQLERRIETWAEFRPKLDRLRHRLLEQAQPAIQAATPPQDLEVPEGKPCFYRAAEQLLSGTRLELSQVPDYAERFDKAAELAEMWGELYNLARLVREAIGELQMRKAELSETEKEMLETARHNLNSAARDLWEAVDLDDLQERETRGELKRAQDLARQLLDPWVYDTGVRQMPTELVTPEGKELEEGPYPVRTIRALVRTYTQMEGYQLPRLDFDTYEGLASDVERIAYVDRSLLLGERTVTRIALFVALVVGLERYFTTNFGTLADYLTLLVSGVTAKAGLELINLVLSRLLARQSPES
ncbi:MAG: hypothetical protein ACP5JG_09670 [Anaerolineae bacterium]